jgi:hypothetical protein
MYINIILYKKNSSKNSILQPLLENMWLDHYANHSFGSGTIIVGFE